MRLPARLALALLLAAPLAGCLDLEAATVPDRLLEGRGGNGWVRNSTASQDEPTGSTFVKTQTLVYEDRATRPYTGTISVTTLRTLLRPSEGKLRDEVEARVKDQAEAKGIRIGKAVEGSRGLANDAESFWFTYNGTAETSSFFSQSAEVKVFGEVFQCAEEKTVVITVGLAQVSDVRSIGGVPLPSEPDPTTWREIVNDPRGRVDGSRGSDGLAYNVAC